MSRDPIDSSKELVFRRGKLRRRDDYAVDLFREALALLGEPEAMSVRERLPRLLMELRRFYDPVRNGPVLDPAIRREVVELAEAGRHDRAREILQDCLRVYTRLDPPAAGSTAGSSPS